MILTLAGSSILIILGVSLLVPSFVVPMFFECTDLEAGELRKAILADASNCGMNVAAIKVINGACKV